MKNWFYRNLKQVADKDNREIQHDFYLSHSARYVDLSISNKKQWMDLISKDVYLKSLDVFITNKIKHMSVKNNYVI